MPGQPNRNRPAITRAGHVIQVGTQIRVTGWALASCATNCPCHINPDSGQLTIAEDQEHGLLGLASHGPACGCCQPWTADELASVLRDLLVASQLLGGTTV